MPRTTQPETQASANSGKAEKIIRNGKPPVFADDLAEIKMNSYTTKLVFGMEDSSGGLNTMRETVTVALPTPQFLNALVLMMAPILSNEEALSTFTKEYKGFVEKIEAQLAKIKESKQN